MPIRTEELERLTRRVPVLIAEQRRCKKCGYDLIGLKTDAKCPECGMAITPPRPANRFTDQMSGAPISWLRRYQRGTMLLCVGGWGMAVGLLAWAVSGHVGGVLFALFASVIWVAGTFISTLPRPQTRDRPNPRAEWAHVRRWCRVMQPAWPVGLAGAAIIQGYGVVTPLSIAIVAAVLLIGVAGWWPLLVLHSNMAYWASDTELADRLRNCSWASAPGMGIGAAMVGAIGGMTGGLGPRFVTLGYFAAGLMVSVWVALGLFALWYTLSTVWGLMRLGHYAMAAHMNVEMRDERLRARAAKARDAAANR